MESRHTIGLVMSVISEEGGLDMDESVKNSEIADLNFGDLPQQEESKS